MTMEFLNNFWLFLCNENLKLSTLIGLPFYFIESYLSFWIFTKLFNIKYNSKSKIIYLIFTPFIAIISTLFIPKPYNVLLNYFIIFVLIKFVFKITFIKAFLSTFVPFVTFTLISTLILPLYIKIFSVTTNTLQSIPIHKLVYNLLIYLLIWIILVLTKNKSISLKGIFNFDIKTNITILFSLIIGLFVLCIQTFLTYYYINILPIGITLFHLSLLATYFFISFYSLNKVIKLHKTMQELESAENYNNSLTILYDNVKGFKHDFNNIIDTLGGYITDNDIDGLKKYYSSLRKDCIDTKNIEFLNPNIINNPGIYNLLALKYKKASDENIKINFECLFDFSKLHMPIYEFSRVFGILLDNSIEASKECNEKIINLSFRYSQKNHVQIICIENTYKDKNINTNKIFEKGISGKKNHSGIGLWEVNKIVHKYNNCVLKTSNNENYFKQQLEIYY